MSTTERTSLIDPKLIEGLIEALANKHSEVDLNFQRVTLRVPGMQQIGIELNGTISLSVHMHDMSEEERRAISAKRVELMSAPQ